MSKMLPTSKLLLAAAIISSSTAQPFPSSSSQQSIQSSTLALSNEELAIACYQLPQYKAAVEQALKDLQLKGNDVDDKFVINEQLKKDRENLRVASEACKRIAEMNGGTYDSDKDGRTVGEQRAEDGIEAELRR